MVVISKKAISEFVIKNPTAQVALERWYAIVEKADWKGFNDVRKDFNSVDAVGDGLFIFNIKGNDYRLSARIIFRTRTYTHCKYYLVRNFSSIMPRDKDV